MEYTVEWNKLIVEYKIGFNNQGTSWQTYGLSALEWLCVKGFGVLYPLEGLAFFKVTFFMIICLILDVNTIHAHPQIIILQGKLKCRESLLAVVCWVAVQI